jgi:hypothetical protein
MAEPPQSIGLSERRKYIHNFVTPSPPAYFAEIFAGGRTWFAVTLIHDCGVGSNAAADRPFRRRCGVKRLAK